MGKLQGAREVRPCHSEQRGSAQALWDGATESHSTPMVRG